MPLLICRAPGPHSCWAAVAAQTTPAQTVSWSIPIINDGSGDYIQIPDNNYLWHFQL